MSHTKTDKEITAEILIAVINSNLAYKLPTSISQEGEVHTPTTDELALVLGQMFKTLYHAVQTPDKS